MKSPWRLMARIVFLGVVLVLLAVGGVLAWFTSWRSDKMAELDGASQVAETRLGPVEFLTGGDGPAVLVFHGAPGGYDQAMLLGASLRDEGFQVIAPSRPGYLRTPLATGLLPEQQADAMAALLDDLGIESTTVLGFSEGAPAALFFALRHPGRVSALALVSPVTKRFDPNAKTGGAEFGREILKSLTGDVGAWVAWEIAERDLLRSLDWFLALTSSHEAAARNTSARLIAADLEQRDWYRSLIGTFNPLSPRETGARNDSLQLRSLQDFDFAKITAPTLLIHGAMDRCVPVADTEAAAAKISGATLFVVPDAGHLVQLGGHGGEVHKKLLEFFQRHTGGQALP
jgi:pimeloyl-ACP methyl ester carboxylesterase